jgi:hypothetical protein
MSAGAVTVISILSEGDDVTPAGASTSHAPPLRSVHSETETSAPPETPCPLITTTEGFPLVVTVTVFYAWHHLCLGTIRGTRDHAAHREHHSHRDQRHRARFRRHSLDAPALYREIRAKKSRHEAASRTRADFCAPAIGNSPATLPQS